MTDASDHESISSPSSDIDGLIGDPANGAVTYTKGGRPVATSIKALSDLDKFRQDRDSAQFAEHRTAVDLQAAKDAAVADLAQRRQEFTEETLASPPSRAALAVADDRLSDDLVAALRVHAASFDAHNDRIRDVGGIARLLDLVDLEGAPVMIRTCGTAKGLQIEGAVVHKVSGWSTRVQGIFGTAVFKAKGSIR